MSQLQCMLLGPWMAPGQAPWGTCAALWQLGCRALLKKQETQQDASLVQVLIPISRVGAKLLSLTSSEQASKPKARGERMARAPAGPGHAVGLRGPLEGRSPQPAQDYS